MTTDLPGDFPRTFHEGTDRGTQTAQSEPHQQGEPAPAQNGNAPAPAAPKVDETALRYFARQGDSRRLQAEIARLRALYPGWTPPANPAALPAQGDPKLDAMWKLYADRKYAQVRKAMADRQRDEPSWSPPADLLKLLTVAEARETLVNASNLKQFETVIRIASQNPSLLICDDVDVLWRVAEAFAETERLQRAQDAYLYILKNCNDPHERLATVKNPYADQLALHVVAFRHSAKRLAGKVILRDLPFKRKHPSSHAGERRARDVELSYNEVVRVQAAC
jgi:hypothetical protein